MVNRVFWNPDDEIRLALLSARQRRLWAARLRTWAWNLEAGTLQLRVLENRLQKLSRRRLLLN
jgi:hypothetical protein